jgi:hypothetical protein
LLPSFPIPKKKPLKIMYNLCLQIFFKTSICTPQRLHPFDKIIHNKWDMICTKIPCKWSQMRFLPRWTPNGCKANKVIKNLKMTREWVVDAHI